MQLHLVLLICELIGPLLVLVLVLVVLLLLCHLLLMYLRSSVYTFEWQVRGFRRISIPRLLNRSWLRLWSSMLPLMARE